MYILKKSLKYWLWGSICIIIINFIIFVFRNKIDQIVLLWVVMLTPVALLALYPLAHFLNKNKSSRNESGF
jgi:hypothetical protein